MVITERSFAVQMQERTESLEPPIVERLQALQSRQEALSSTLEASRAERERSVKCIIEVFVCLPSR